jgi:hypothetical protein
MQATSRAQAAMRITDIINAKAAGAKVQLKTRFEVLPVDFHHGQSPFQAYIFLAQYHGTIDGAPFEFRKCYARGCPNNLCTHVSQAVNIANRYLQRDYHRLKSAGIETGETLFTLDAMVIKFEQLQDSEQPPLTIPGLVGMAYSGSKISVDLALDYLPAVEHFAHQQNAQTYLSGEFTARIESRIYKCHRCFACFATEKSAEEKPRAIQVANARLELIFEEFARVGILHRKQYFQ